MEGDRGRDSFGNSAQIALLAGHYKLFAVIIQRNMNPKAIAVSATAAIPPVCVTRSNTHP